MKRSRTGDEINEEIISKKVTIKKPFYASNFALIIYLSLGVSLFLIVHYTLNTGFHIPVVKFSFFLYRLRQYHLLTLLI